MRRHHLDRLGGWLAAAGTFASGTGCIVLLTYTAAYGELRSTSNMAMGGLVGLLALYVSLRMADRRPSASFIHDQFETYAALLRVRRNLGWLLYFTPSLKLQIDNALNLTKD